MTTPQERMRSLRWGGELLDLMQADQTVPADLRGQAAQLRARYPTAGSLASLLESSNVLLPQAHADAIEATSQLFQKLELSGVGCETMRRHLRFTLRHFPLPGDAQFMATLGSFGGLSDWIEREPPAA